MTNQATFFSLSLIHRLFQQTNTEKDEKTIAANCEKVAEEVVDIMGGQVVELECIRQRNAGKLEGCDLGVAEGRPDGFIALRIH